MRDVYIEVAWGHRSQVKLYNYKNNWRLRFTDPKGKVRTCSLDLESYVWLRIVSPICSFRSPLTRIVPQFKDLQKMALRRKKFECEMAKKEKETSLAKKKVPSLPKWRLSA